MIERLVLACRPLHNYTLLGSRAVSALSFLHRPHPRRWRHGEPAVSVDAEGSPWFIARMLTFVRFSFIRIIWVVATIHLSSTPTVAQTFPALPRLTVDTTYAPPSGRTIAVRAGESFQAALNRAQSGDVITLEAAATFTGPFTLPNKPGSTWITIRTSALETALPPPGHRVTLSHAAAMARLIAASGSVLTAAPGAHHFRFIGIEIRPKDDVFLYNLVLLGATERASADLPHHIIFDRCYLHGDPKKGTRRGIAMNSRETAVIDSYLSDFKEVGADSQAIAGWNGPGPFKIVNNYLEGAGENVIFGGADPSIRDLVPSDIEVRGNQFSKPLSWKIGHATYTGTAWSVKNLFELKNARRVFIEGNLFEHNWVHAQNGYAILFTVRNQQGTAPWSVIEDVTFSNNIVRRIGSGINILGMDSPHPSQRTTRILIRNNLFETVGDGTWGEGRLFQVLAGAVDVIIEHNTSFPTHLVVEAEGASNAGFIFRNNISSYGNYGIVGTGTAPGIHTLDKYFPGGLVSKNVFFGANAVQDASRNPQDNHFLRASDDVGFVDQARGDYRLRASSRFKHAGTDGKDLGADFEPLRGALSATQGLPPQ